MISITITHQVTLIAFWLVFTRVATTAVQLPIFDNTSVPMMAKILGSLVISYCFFPFIKGTLLNEITAVGADNFWYLTIFHTIVGLLIGYLVRVIMGVFVSAGSVMTQQMGFGSVSYFDPTFVTKVGPIEKIIQWTLVIMILGSGALLPMFKGLLYSFSSINLTTLWSSKQMGFFYFEFFKSLFITALILASPILFSNLLLNLVLGIVARTIPQMNILMVSFVVNIGVGLIVFLAISEEFFYVAYEAYVKRLGDWFQFVI